MKEKGRGGVEDENEVYPPSSGAQTSIIYSLIARTVLGMELDATYIGLGKMQNAYRWKRGGSEAGCLASHPTHCPPSTGSHRGQAMSPPLMK